MDSHSVKRHMEGFQDDLSRINAEIGEYNSAYHQTKKVDTTKSIQLKMKLCRLLREASKVLATGDYLQFKKEVLEVFSESVVSADDEESFLYSVSDLVQRGVLSENEVRSVTDNSAWQRRLDH